MFIPIENTPRDYAWGRAGAISALLGRAPTDAIEAELWLGAHHGSPSRVVGTASTLLDVAPDLPFILKVLATAEPLSIQAHPDAVQARTGFEREEAAGIPRDAPDRSYRDPFAKPELIVALSDRFEALAGFRPAVESAGEISRIVDRVGARSAAQPLLDRLDDDATVGDALGWLLTGSPEAVAVIEAVAAGLREAPAQLPWASRIVSLYPGDPGAVGALLLHHIVLRRGEALYLPPGNVHAYLGGIGIELMGPSDNVLRGGLTRKHIDVGELARTIVPNAGPAPLLAPSRLPGGGVLYAPADPEAALSLALLDSETDLPLAGPAIALCTDGAFSLAGRSASIDLARGDAVLITPDEELLRVSGTGALYVARGSAAR